MPENPDIADAGEMAYRLQISTQEFRELAEEHDFPSFTVPEGGEPRYQPRKVYDALEAAEAAKAAN